ncbi:hypothetical protein [uncultured Anaerococcus sp.]|uniref:hypothetical protein n=1 Tax=uncultured Anaerococcus sp. TaxID=293428 RepID=UPI00288A092B|nr:hypothetical protein [uncultured Anaerococcus sp.]
MKNNNIKKIVLALALASVALVPKIDKAYATEATTSEQSYFDIYQDFTKTIIKAREIKKNYKYINADFYYQRGLDEDLKAAESLEEKVAKSAPNDEAKANMESLTNNLKFAIDALNGEKVSIKELSDLLEEYETFIKSDAFTNATLKQKSAYIDAHDKARSYKILYGRNEDSLEKVKVDEHTKAMKDAKASIENSYEPVKNKGVLKAEIDKSVIYRYKKDQYTEKSFKAFMAALKLAETSMEDNSKMKSAREYQEIADSLQAARLALVEEISEANKEQIKKLEEAIIENGVTVRAVNLLFEISPNKVEDVKSRLLVELNESKKLQQEARDLLAKLKGIKG